MASAYYSKCKDSDPHGDGKMLELFDSKVVERGEEILLTIIAVLIPLMTVFAML